MASIQKDDRFQLKVRTGSAQLNRVVYELAYHQFSDVLPLREKEPFTGVMEITFISSDQSYFTSRSSSETTREASDGWYSGEGEQRDEVSASRKSGAAGTFIWQNSTMLVVVRKQDGGRIWSADYNYKGGWEMSGFAVNTPEEAARLVLKRLRDRIESDRRRKQ